MQNRAYMRFALITIIALIEHIFCVNYLFADRPAFERETTNNLRALNFIVIGDWGDRGSDKQKKVAKAMEQYAAKHNTRFIVSTGDNFYTDGVKNTSDPLWKKAFLDVYGGPTLKNILWLSTLGNHDHHRGGNAQAQIDYSRMMPKRWFMPHFFYDTTMVIDKSMEILFIMLDTTPLVENEEKASSTYNISDYWKHSRYQLDSLEVWLGNSNAKWRFVIGHHPIYSTGIHGDNPKLKELIYSTLKKYGVQAYFAGHDHNLQLFEEDSITYVVSGGGGRGEPWYRRLFSKESEKKPLMHQWIPGFAGVTIYADRAEIQFVDFSGNASEIHAIRNAN